MAVAYPIVPNASQAVAAARVARTEALVLKIGEVLGAVVVARSSAGLTTLKIGDQVVTAKLPNLDLPAGSSLQLQGKATGSAPQLQVSNAGSTGQGSEKTAVPVPTLPPSLVAELARVVVEPSVVRPQPMAPPQQAAGSRAAPEQANPESGQRVASSGSQNGPRLAPAPASGPPVSKPEGDGAFVRSAVVLTARTAEPAPMTRGVISLPAAPPSATPAPQPTTQASPAISGRDAVSRAPSPQMQPQASQTTTRAGVANTSAVQVAATSSEETLAPSLAAISTAATKMALQGAPASATPVQPQVSSQAAEPAAPNPLLLAQSTPRPPASAADLPRSPVVLSTPIAVPAAQQPPPVPSTPQAALAQMLPEALGRQNSSGPLLMSLAVLVQKPGVLPEPVLRAALGALAQRIIVSSDKVQPSQIEQAVQRSGLTLEASLLQGTPSPMDAKAGLLALREALGKWEGGTPTPASNTRDAAPPPIKGLPLRAVPVDPAPLPDIAKDAGRLLHSEADAAISRLKLMQLASLPDSDPGKPSAPSQRMELPFLIGHELVMAQIQVGRDAPRREQDRKRGWTMRFALNFSQTGEVGAEVGVLGKAVNVALWAAEPETAVAMNETLTELTRSLEAAGLKPGTIRIRHGVPVDAQK